MMTALERIDHLSMPEPNSGCWLWLGTIKTNPAGQQYGRLVVGSRADGDRQTIAAHRLSYMAHRGKIPIGMLVCHHCDNTLCVNPAHLFVGTYKDNADDRDRKGRNKAPPKLSGSTHPSARYSDAIVAEIRRSTVSSRLLAKTVGVSDAYIRQLRRGECRPSPPEARNIFDERDARVIIAEDTTP